MEEKITSYKGLNKNDESWQIKRITTYTLTFLQNIAPNREKKRTRRRSKLEIYGTKSASAC